MFDQVISIVLALWSIPIIKGTIVGAVGGALTGAAGAARTDFIAYKNMKDEDEFLRYNWRLARFRWKQGAIVGAASGSGLGSMLGAAGIGS